MPVLAGPRARGLYSRLDSSREVGVAQESGSFRRVLARVMTVQVLTLLALWWLQSHYGR